MSDGAKIDVLVNGPYIVDGLDELTNSKDKILESEGKVALCRCGTSENKPYCDGAHKRIGFESTVEKGESDASAENGERKICVLHNGPLEVSNAIELMVNDDMNLASDNPYYLCRCGASENKPFCDGSHKKIGFTDEDN